MIFRRRRLSAVPDPEAAKAAAAANGAYDPSRETPWSLEDLTKEVDKLWEGRQPPRSAGQTKQFGPRPHISTVPPLATVTPLHSSAAPGASVTPVDAAESPGPTSSGAKASGPGQPTFPSDECPDCGGHIGWIDHGNHWDGTCYGICGARTTKFKPLPDDEKRRQTRDQVWARRDKQALIDELMRRLGRVDELERENRELKSELRIARQERDRARGERDDARAAINNSRLAP